MVMYERQVYKGGRQILLGRGTLGVYIYILYYTEYVYICITYQVPGSTDIFQMLLLIIASFLPGT